jgi:uncharacterized membrane protein YtjA (UPF0391 family)
VLKIFGETATRQLRFIEIRHWERLPPKHVSLQIEEMKTMLYWFLVSAVVAAIAGALSVGVTATSIGMAQVLLMMLCAFVVISLFTGVMRRVR